MMMTDQRIQQVQPQTATRPGRGHPPTDIENMFLRMRKEANRLKSFSNPGHMWPKDDIDVRQLAKAGFFYLLTGDRTICAFCREAIAGWRAGMDPFREHSLHYPHCPFVLGHDVGNIPIDLTIEQRNAFKPRGQDVCGNNLPSTDLAEDYGLSIPEHQNGANLDLNELGVREHIGPKHRRFFHYESRLSSFFPEGNEVGVRWPISDKVPPEKMAEAGFFYPGHADKVLCFYCDGGLLDWEAGDDPWLEHAKWWPKCEYVLRNKGEAFVKHALTIRQQQEQQQQQQQQNNQQNDQDVNMEDMETEPSTTVIEGQQQAITSINQGEDAINESSQRSHDEGYSSQEFYSGQSSPTSSYHDEGYSSQSSQGSSPPTSQSAIISASQEEEFERIRHRMMCKICWDQEIGLVFLPCGHLVSCSNCAQGLTDCPICKKKIKGTARTFFT